MDSFVQQLLEHGVLGIVSAVALWFAYAQTKKLEECQEKRVADIERVVGAISESTRVVLDNTEITKRLVEEVDRLNDRGSTL